MYPHSPRAKNPLGQEIHTRHLDALETRDLEETPFKFIALALVQLRNELKRIPVMIADRSRRVDEYSVQSLTPESALTFTVQPQFDLFDEVIESIIVTGPPAATANLQIGDRYWALVMPASGILPITSIGMILGRNDIRQLTASAAGEWSLELMGYADTRGNSA
jgi:hypothetical protein